MITPIEHYPELAIAIGVPDLYFKREDKHLYGSHKGRSIPVMIDKYYAEGDRLFAISSSGNAALASALYTREINNKNPKNPMELDIFVGNNIDPSKLDKLKKLADKNIRILIKERPLQALTQVVNEGVRGLRQSTDDTSLVGYTSLAEELAGLKNISTVFIGTSSGTTAQALSQYFLKNKLPIQVHIIQTPSCHPMSDAFGVFEGEDEKSSASAIVDITAFRKKVLVPLIEKTGGFGWFATNENISAAQEMTLKHTGLEISTNSALSVVGAMQAAYAGHDIKGAVVCMICGD